jgi:hypothetical protein
MVTVPIFRGRQELPNVHCCINRIAYRTMAGYESQMKFLGEVLVITDFNGVHVFAGGK